jgi:choline dehydrogenase
VGTPNLLLYIPKGFFFTLQSSKLTTTYLAEPFPMGFREPWQRGRVLGGSTAVNGMMYVRGQQADYDSLEQRGNPGWGGRTSSGPTSRWRITP